MILNTNVEKLKEFLELKSDPVGIKFLRENKTKIEPTEEKRFCQAILKASNGDEMLVNLFNRCFTPNLLFGFRNTKYYKKKTLKKYGFKFVLISPLNKMEDFDVILVIVNAYQVLQLIVSFNQILEKKLQF